jgi:hypothetical protein
MVPGGSVVRLVMLALLLAGCTCGPGHFCREAYTCGVNATDPRCLTQPGQVYDPFPGALDRSYPGRGKP